MNKVQKTTMQALFPVLILPLLLSEVKKNPRNKINFLLIALSMSFFGYFIIPYVNGDSEAHYRTFKVIETLTFQEFKLFLETKSDPGLFYIMYLISKIKLNFYFLPAISVFVSYFLFFKSFNILEIDDSKKFFFFLIIYMYIPFFDLVYGIRNGLAISILCYSFSQYVMTGKKIKTLILITLAILIHSMSIVYIVVILIPLICKKLKFYKAGLLLSILLGYFLLNPRVFTKVLIFIPYLNESIIYKLEFYLFNNKNLGEITTIKTKTGLIYFYIKNFVIMYLPLVYLLLTKKENKFSKYALLTYSISFLFVKFHTISYRYSIIGIYFTLFSFFQEYKFLNSKLKKMKNIFFLSGIIYLLINIYAHKEVYFYSTINIFKYNLISFVLENTEKRTFILK